MQEKQLKENEKLMKKVEMKSKQDDLRQEYNLKDLRVRKLGSERKSFGDETVQLEADVAKIFPDSHSVNEALRFLIRITRENKMSFSGPDNRGD